ncbi:MAG: hypothetical protein JXR48_09550 [Candidatus Delongbacteria bacterium]|nr:hypothetical protein [Candidatus Delongbacteria bacterium]MBN2835197.1 hypothetical protein [Candidatus Delongbacteria bacterium]
MKKIILLLSSIFLLISCSEKNSSSPIDEEIERINTLQSVNNILSMEYSENYLWLGTTNGVVKLDEEGYIIKKITKDDGLVSDSIYTILSDTKGRIWFGTHNGISVLDDKELITIKSEERLISNYINKITEDNDGNFWIGTDNGINFFDEHQWILYKYSDGLPGNFINSVFHKDGILYFGTDNGFFIKNGENWKSYTENDGLVNNTVFSIVSDETKLYIGTQNGLSIFENETFSVIENLPGTMVKDLLWDSNKLYIATNTGIGYFANDSITAFNYTNGTISSYFTCVEKVDNKVYFSGNKGLFSLGENNEFQNFVYGPTSRVLDLIEFGTDSLFILTESEILKNMNLRWSIETTWVDLDASTFNHLMRDNDKLYLSTNYDGLYIIENDTIINWNKDNSQLTSDKIYKTKMIDGILWILTSKGAFKAEGEQWQLYDKDSGLASSKVFDIYVSGEKLLFAGDKGLTYFDGTNFIIYDETNQLENKYLKKIIKFDDSNVIIISDYSLYYTLFNLDSNTFTNVDIIQTNSTTWVEDIVVDENILYIGTNKGLQIKNENQISIAEDFDDLYISLLVEKKDKTGIYIMSSDKIYEYKK